jgi:hypothetical protein
VTLYPFFFSVKIFLLFFFQLDFFAPLKSLLLSSTLNSDSHHGSGNSTPSRAAVVDSKAIRKAHCQVYKK